MSWLSEIGSMTLVGFGGLIGWILKSKMEETRQINDSLREQRREIYKNVAKPFILIFSKRQKEAEKYIRDDFSRVAQDLTMYGSDNVVKTFGIFRETARINGEQGENAGIGETAKAENTIRTITWFGKLLLEMRKDMGNQETKLTEADMIRIFVNDWDSFSEAHKDEIASSSDKK